MAGSLSHVNTKTVSCQRSYGRDKLIASLEQEGALSSRGPRRGFPHGGGGGEGGGVKRCLMDLGFISRRLSRSFIVNPSNPEKGLLTKILYKKQERVSEHTKARKHTNSTTQDPLSCRQHNTPGKRSCGGLRRPLLDSSLLHKVIFP